MSSAEFSTILRWTRHVATTTGRTREYRRNVGLPVPDDFLIPTCGACGEEVMVPEVSEKLDDLLRREFLRRQSWQAKTCVRVLSERHGVTQQHIEDACGITRSYLSHVLGEQRETSATLMRLLEVFAMSPEAFEYALDGTPFDRRMVTLFTVAGSRQYRTEPGFRAPGRYRASYSQFGARTEPA